MSAPQEWYTYGFGLLSQHIDPTRILAGPETVSLVAQVVGAPPGVTSFMLVTKTGEEYFISKSDAELDVKSQSGKYWLRAKKITYPGTPNAIYAGHVSDLGDKKTRDVFVAFDGRREFSAEPVLEKDYTLKVLPLDQDWTLKDAKLKISRGSVYYNDKSFGEFKPEPHSKGHKHHTGPVDKMVEGWFIPGSAWDVNSYVIGFRHYHDDHGRLDLPHPGDPECTDPHVGATPPPPPPPY
ncbi:MAG TPA: hypothetical protein VF173_35735 [Thermoanaerobaculia bacterium]|nr:hypothetical protein [Thermoanaerobaculia bacterium]